MKNKPPARFLSRWLVALLLVPLAWGYDFTRYSGQPITWNPGTVTMRLQLGSSTVLSDGSTYNSSVQTALQSWNTQLATLQFANQVGAATAPVDNNSVNEIGFDSTVYGTAFDANVLAITIYYYSTTPRGDGTYRQTQADIIFNSAYSWDSYRGDMRSAQEIQRVALHELGHVLGLAHPDTASPPQNVTAVMNSHISNLDSLANDDIAGAQFLYGAAVSAPIFTNQPANQTVYAGQAAQFNVAASGYPVPTFQWQKGGVDINGATNGTFSIVSAVAGDAGTYICIATNSVGSTPSNSATLTVTPTTLPSFTTQPSSQTITEGTAVTFNAVASGAPAPIFQWRKDGVNIGGATAGSYTIASTTMGNAGSYTVVASNLAGATTSNGAILTVNAAILPSFTMEPVSQTITAGNAVTFTIVASGLPTPTFQWKKNGININGATGGSYSIANVAAGDAGNYTVVATNFAGSVSSTIAVLSVKYAPLFITQPVSQGVSIGVLVTFYVETNGNPVPSYQWQKNGVNINGATSSYYIIANVATGDAANYRVIATNSVGSATSNTATLTVNDQVYTFATLAGITGNAGSADGTGSAARFNFPNGVAVDGKGNVYIGDQLNHTIRKITPGGVVTTLAGLAGNWGSVDGTGSAARFHYPIGVAVDGTGNVYVGDQGNYTVRKITPEGVVTTLAGTAGSYGSTDGIGSAARFDTPYGVAVDGMGNVFVADMFNNTIRKITPSGVVTTLAGTSGSYGSTDGTGSAARFSAPYGVAVDEAGNVYVSDTGNNMIRKITPGGVVTTLAGFGSGSVDGKGSAARFDRPNGVAVDGAGNVYVADSQNSSIRWGALAPPVLASTTLASGTYGQSFSYTVVFAGALSTNCSASGLPSGLTFNPSTGAIAGIPSVLGTFPVTLGAINGAGSSTATLILTVQPGIGAPSNAIISISVE